ncbi:DUF3798 domain-containing protein [uncultured Sphaerochaeta sp.]|uniref:DUF3798 domain-containing protein n=1 Tax=uncultured Sphaerochaeta sp. TaxID=886478 RepID=UPI002A0A4E21|nr:DUF3798 domain-containing protein [uncultured Sphaerochaeta sp.]
MKKILSVIVVSLLVLCSGFAQGSKASSGTNGKAMPYKIGIMTATVSQAEEEFRVAQAMKVKYGDMIIHQTFPDKAASEQETTISIALSMASDPMVKAIIFNTANEGTAAAMDKVRQKRPDILLLAGVPNEAPDVICASADLVFHPDVANMGLQVAEAAYKMGAKTLVHYSFPRHMAQPLNIARRGNMKAACEKYGIAFIDGTSPDPMSDAGIAGTQQFILEDVPRKVEQYGEDTAFFGTNAGQQEPMCKAVYESHALYPMPDNPSVFYAFPGALGIEVPENEKGNVAFMKDAISAKLALKNMNGRMGAWSAPMHTMFINCAVQYAMEYCDGVFTNRADYDEFTKIFSAFAGGDVSVRKYVDINTNKQYDNFFVVLGKFITF